MSEVVLLGDVVASYSGVWVRVANSRDLPAVQIHDRFREQGFGEGAEELEVEIIDLSPVSGASRIFFRRAANNTKAEVHRLGAVMLQTNPVSVNHFIGGPFTDDSADLIRESRRERDEQLVRAGGGFTHTWNGGKADNATAPIGALDTESPEPVKRGRGRPPGSKNKPKSPLQRVTVPAWPSV